MSDNDFRSELEMWTDLWDDAQEQGVHPEVPKPKSKDVGFSGNTAQDNYYDYLDSDVEDEFQDEVLQEEKIPNPVYPDSAGADSDKKPAWVKEDLLKDIQTLKDKLFKAENKLAKLGSGNKLSETPLSQMKSADNDVMSQIESLRKKIEKVSDHLGIEDEPSPWQIKRD